MDIRSGLRRIGRPLLAGVCITGGWSSFKSPEPRAGKGEAAGLPEPTLLVKVNAVTMVVAGVALALGIRPREAAVVLIGSLVPTTIVGHPFWQEEGPGRAAQRIHFSKNLSMIGGLLLVVADG